MLQLAVLTDRRSLAVTLRARPLDAERSDGALGKQPAEFLADVDQLERSST